MALHCSRCVLSSRPMNISLSLFIVTSLLCCVILFFPSNVSEQPLLSVGHVHRGAVWVAAEWHAYAITLPADSWFRSKLISQVPKLLPAVEHHRFVNGQPDFGVSMCTVTLLKMYSPWNIARVLHTYSLTFPSFLERRGSDTSVFLQVMSSELKLVLRIFEVGDAKVLDTGATGNTYRTWQTSCFAHHLRR